MVSSRRNLHSPQGIPCSQSTTPSICSNSWWEHDMTVYVLPLHEVSRNKQIKLWLNLIPSALIQNLRLKKNKRYRHGICVGSGFVCNHQHGPTPSSTALSNYWLLSPLTPPCHSADPWPWHSTIQGQDRNQDLNSGFTTGFSPFRG